MQLLEPVLEYATWSSAPSSIIRSGSFLAAEVIAFLYSCSLSPLLALTSTPIEERYAIISGWLESGFAATSVISAPRPTRAAMRTDVSFDTCSDAAIFLPRRGFRPNFLISLLRCLSAKANAGMFERAQSNETLPFSTSSVSFRFESRETTPLHSTPLRSARPLPFLGSEPEFFRPPFQRLAKHRDIYR